MSQPYSVVSLMVPCLALVSPLFQVWTSNQFMPILIILRLVFFGKRFTPTNVGMLALFAALGGVVAGLVNGELYGVHAGEDGKCFGELCFKNSFIISGSCAGLVFISSIWLSWRTRKNVALYENVEQISDTKALVPSIDDEDPPTTVNYKSY